MNKNKKIWDQILNLIRDDISNEIHFENFGNCRILLSNNNDLIISGTKINIELLQDDYLSKLQESANQILEKKVTIKFREATEEEIAEKDKFDVEIKQESTFKQKEDQLKVFEEPKLKTPEEIKKERRSQSRLAKKLIESVEYSVDEDNFRGYGDLVIYDGNSFAIKIGRDFIKNYENKFFKTCFFHGDVGVGKTHLAFTLVNYFKELYKDKKIIYVDSFKLNFEYNNHLRDSCFDVKSFIQKFADCDFLIIDDLHKFQGLNNINSMLFSLVEFLLNRNKKIIFFSSEPLRDINDFDPALKSRILSGIQCEIKEADTNVIKTLIKRFFETQSPNLKLTAGAIEYLAFLLGKDIRRVYGHLATLSFYLNAGEQLIMVDAKIIEELLEKIGILDTIPKNNRDDVYNQIVLICEKLKADVTDVLGRSRKQEIVNNRNVIAYILKTEMKMSLKKIGKVLDRDHTTIKNSLNQMENEFKRNKHFKDYVESLFSSKLSTK